MSSRRTSNDSTRWLSCLGWVSIILGVVIARLASRDPRSCLTLTHNIGARQQKAPLGSRLGTAYAREPDEHGVRPYRIAKCLIATSTAPQPRGRVETLQFL